MFSQKDRAPSVSHLAIAFRVLLMLLVLHPGSTQRHGGNRSCCKVPRSLGCSCSHRVHGTDIKCGDVPLTEVPGNLSRPESLWMSRTGLQLDDGVPYPSLKDLHIEGNSIPRIRDGAFEQLENLITLILVDNGIQLLTGRTFAGLGSLEFLSLSGNAIVHIRAEVFSRLNMPNLKILKLSNCNISSLDPNSFSGLQNLALLDLSSNKIETLPVLGDSEGLPSLMTLQLCNNRLHIVDGSTFQFLTSVRHLHLSHNRISVLDRSSFSGSMQKTLLSLHLRHNGLAEVEGLAICQLESLTTLDISFNSLRTLTADDIPGNVEKILIHDNPWTCANCENSWILENPNVKNWNKESSVTCSWPDNGRRFFDGSLPSDCDEMLPTPFPSKTMTTRNQIIWISTASVLAAFTIITSVIYVYVRCIGDRRHFQTSKARLPAAESKQCLVIDDNA